MCCFSEIVRLWCSSVLFFRLLYEPKSCVSIESSIWQTPVNVKTSVSQLFVAMSCDEKTSKRKKKRSKQNSIAGSNTHTPKLVKHSEVSSVRFLYKQCTFNLHPTKNIVSLTLQLISLHLWCYSCVHDVVEFCLLSFPVFYWNWNVCF